MRFEVPQFIDVEDKIFGPLTFKQFIYLAGGAGLAYVSYKLIPFPVNFLFVIIFIVLGLALAFYKINGRTFIEVAQAFIFYQIKGKLYIWKRDMTPKKATPLVLEPIPQKPTMKATPSVDDLAKNLDILDR